MGASFLITLREGLEAALIISIILAYLARVRRWDQFRNVWLGTGAAVVVSLVAGTIIVAMVGGLTGRAEEVFEGLAMLLAVGVLSYMVNWMRRQARYIRTHLEKDVDRALEVGSALAMASLAFVVVVREGLETVLFLLATSRLTTFFQLWVGAVSGLALAVVIGYAWYRGSRRVNPRTFFNVTGVLIIFFAAGLCARGIHELQEGGVFPIVKEEVWNTNHILNEKTGLGLFLKSLFGYNGNPELLEVLFYVVYLGIVLWLFWRPTPRPT